MRIALINPPPRSRADEHWARHPLLGLAYIASALRANGHDVRVFDGKLGRMSAPQITAAVLDAGPSLVGITCMTVEFPTVRQIARDIKGSGLRTILVLGGPHVNAVGAKVLEECPEADSACIGEGEALMNELASALETGRGLPEIAGLVFRDQDQIVTNRPREYCDNYDKLPFPAWDLFALDDQVPLLTHRGCPFRCNFCAHNSGRTPRYRSAQNVLQEIDHDIRTYRPTIIRIEDETFGLHQSRTKELLNGIIDRGYHERVRFSAQTRVDRIDEEFVRLLKKCNFETLELGVESGNAGILANSGKGITLEQVELAVSLAKKAGLTVWCKFILGHPFETRAHMLETADFIARLNPDRLSVSIMTPFPGTPIYDMALHGRGGYRLLSRNWGDFDKYSTGALELGDVSITRLKAYQLWCYLKLYIKNGRLLELLRLGLGHKTLALSLVGQLLSAVWFNRKRASFVQAKPRVVLFGRHFHPAQEAVALMLTDLARSLAVTHDVSVVCGVSGSELATPRDPEADAGPEQVRVIRLWNTRFAKHRNLGRLANWITYCAMAMLVSLRERVPTIIASTDPPLIPVLAAVLKRVMRCKVIIDCQDLYVDVAATLGVVRKGGILHRVAERLMSFALADADAIVAISKDMRECLLAKGIPSDRVAIINNWIDTESIARLEPGNNALLSRLGLSNRFVFMYAGSLGLVQDFETLLQGLAQLTGDREKWRLVVVTGSNIHKEELIQRVTAHHIQHNTVFLNPAPRAQLSELLSAGTLHCVPLKRGLVGSIAPSKIYGIMAAGRPFLAICDRGCEMADQVLDGHCGLWAPAGDVGAVHAQLQWALDNPEPLERMGHRGREIAVRDYDVRIQTARWSDLINGLQDRGNHARFLHENAPS